MKNFLSNTAFTLIELIVSSLLVVIIILGMCSVNSVLTNNNMDYGQRYLVKSETQTTLSNILNSASVAVGSGTSDSYNNVDQSILIGAGMGDANSLCIHQDPNNTPGNYSDDIWFCYTWFPSATAYPYQIYSCNTPFVPATAGGSTRGAQPCTAASTGFAYLGTARTNPFATASFTNDEFTVTIDNCLDNSAATSPCGTPNNPESTPTGSVSPSQSGM